MQGDVGSIGIAFYHTVFVRKCDDQDNGYYLAGILVSIWVDGCLTIVHRIMLHENLGEAHRKHAYQIMANELKIGHVKVTLSVYDYAVVDFS